MSKVSISLLDPYIMFRKGLIELIRQYKDYNISFDVDTVEELTEKLKNEPLPNILLLEVEIPVKNGYDILLWMEQHYPSIKVIAVSAIHTDYAVSK